MGSGKVVASKNGTLGIPLEGIDLLLFKMSSGRKKSSTSNLAKSQTGKHRVPNFIFKVVVVFVFFSLL